MSPEEGIVWSNILLTLLVRFISVFVVLMVLQIGLHVSGVILSRLVAAVHRESPKK